MTVDIRQFLHDSHHMVIAVVDAEGNPWAVPVGIKSYDAGVFEWVSSSDTVHSRAIEDRNHISLTIFKAGIDRGDDYGFYATAVAEKGEALGGEAHVYRAVCQEAWYNDHTRIKTKIDIKDL
jgi:hypothetical protein